MSGILWLVHASALLCWTSEALHMCSLKGRLPSEDEWFRCVPCPPPRKFSLLCSKDYKECGVNCTVLSKLVDVCLSQYDRYYPKSFTDNIKLKCDQKEACLEQRPHCDIATRNVFETISASCRQTTNHIQSTAPSTSTHSTTHKTTTQTTEVHVTTQVTTFTSIFAVDNDTVSTTNNTHNLGDLETPSTKVQSSSSHAAIFIILILIFVILLIGVLFVALRVRRRFFVTVRTPLQRQTSTDSRAPIIRTDRGYDVLCFTLKRKMTSQDSGVSSSKEMPRGYYEPVPLSSEHVPLSSELVPLSSEHVPLSSEHVPLSSEYVPLSSELVPLSSEHVPLSSELVPLSSEHVPLSSELVPLSSELVPLSSELVPLSSELVPLSREHVPLSSEHVPLSNEHVPLGEDYKPVPLGGGEPVVQERPGEIEVLDFHASSVEDDVIKHGAQETGV